MQVQNKAREIKQEMNQIDNQIKDITYAPGTEPGGNNIIDNDVAPGPQGIVGNAGDNGGHDGDSGGMASDTHYDPSITHAPGDIIVDDTPPDPGTNQIDNDAVLDDTDASDDSVDSSSGGGSSGEMVDED